MLSFIQVSANGTWCSVTPTTKHLQSKWMPCLSLYFVTSVWDGSDYNTNQTNTSHNTWISYCYIITHTNRFNGHFLGKPELASYHLTLTLQSSLSWESSQVRPKLFTSYWTQSYQVFLRHPFCLVPTSFDPIHHLDVWHAQLFRTDKMHSTFGGKFANFNELHNVNVQFSWKFKPVWRKHSFMLLLA